MRGLQWITTAAITVGLSAAAAAQTPASSSAVAATPGSQAVTPSTSATGSPGKWIASGFVGSNFGADTDKASVDFGGQVGYMFRGMVGGELLADFAPSFKLNNALLADNPNVNSYMVNAIGVLPMGNDGRYRPFISAGLGGIQLRSDVLSVASTPDSGTTAANQTKFGGDIGGGVMGFRGNVGIRGDIRYYRAFNNNDVSTSSTASDQFAQTLLSGLDFWRANIGVAVRW